MDEFLFFINAFARLGFRCTVKHGPRTPGGERRVVLVVVPAEDEEMIFTFSSGAAHMLTDAKASSFGGSDV